MPTPSWPIQAWQNWKTVQGTPWAFWNCVETDGFSKLELGLARWPAHLLSKEQRVDGIDVVAGRQWADIMRRYPRSLSLWEGTLESVSVGGYDLCFTEDVLELIPPGDYDQFLARCFSLLRPGGWLVVTMPSPLTGQHDCSRWFLDLGASAQGGHFNEKRLCDLRRDMKSAGVANFRTTVIHTLASGRRTGGWCAVWLWRALAFEVLCEMMPPRHRNLMIFEYNIPRILTAQKLR